MAKKRKAGGRPYGRDRPRDAHDEDSKLRISTYEDVADSEDEFHINRDKIFLEEGPAQKRQRQIEEDEAFLEPSDEEVLPLNDSDLLSEDDLEDVEDAYEPSNGKPRIAKAGMGNEELGLEDQAADEEEDNAGGWGTSRKDYYDADAIETKDDALEEENEARRLERKRLEGMTEADFGFDEAQWLEAGKDSEDEDGTIRRGGVIREVLPRLEITDAMGPEERLKVLRTRYPEFEPLSKEFLELQSIHHELKTAAAKAVNVPEDMILKADWSAFAEDQPLPIAVVKHSALSAYLGVLSMYFALLSSGSTDSNGKAIAMAPDELHDHAIMDTLVRCRDLWEKVKNIIVPEPLELSSKDRQVSNGRDNESPLINDTSSNGLPVTNSTSLPPVDNEVPSKSRKRRKSKIQKSTEAAQKEADERRTEQTRQMEKELAELSVLTANHTSKPLPSSSLPNGKAADNSDSDFGDQTSLTPHEAAEKAKNKKSLRFYTSQIAQKSNKRDAAGRDAGGDADLPYKERFKDRQTRLNAEAEKRGNKPKQDMKADALLGGESDAEDHAAARALREDENGGSEEDYYDLVASQSAAKKADKAARSAAHAQAKAEGGVVRIVEDETVGPDGKRAISYAIEKNRGLAPKRKKDVRNPRVKKRKKYDDKMKKLGSIRPLYKGGEEKSGYSGEKTGIKKGLVKSIKL